MVTKKKPKKKKQKKAKPKAALKKTDPQNSCDVCGTVVREMHCRLVCPKCGAMRDCSDP